MWIPKIKKIPISLFFFINPLPSSSTFELWISKNKQTSLSLSLSLSSKLPVKKRTFSSQILHYCLKIRSGFLLLFCFKSFLWLFLALNFLYPNHFWFKKGFSLFHSISPQKGLGFNTAMMACSMKSCVYCLNGTIVGSKSRGFCPSLVSVQPRDSKSRALPMLGVEFMGKPLAVSDQKGLRDWNLKSPSNFSPHVCRSFAFSALYFGESFGLYSILGTNFQYMISGTSINLCKPKFEMVGEDS